ARAGWQRKLQLAAHARGRGAVGCAELECQLLAQEMHHSAVRPVQPVRAVAGAPVLPLRELASNPALLFQDRLFDRTHADPLRRGHGEPLVVDLEADRAAARAPQAEVAQLPAPPDAAQSP